MSKLIKETETNNKLRMLRQKLDLTYEEMATFLGISKTYYYQLENKKRRLYYHLAIKIANIFHKKPDDIFYDEYKANL